MTSNSLSKQILNVNHATVLDCDVYDDPNGVRHLALTLKPSRGHENECPVCHKKCKPYDVHGMGLRRWRGLDWNGIVVDVYAETHRVRCPEHGIRIADVPWAYPNSGFTKEFDRTAAWMATGMSKSAVAEYLRIDWKSVGRCISRTLNDIEPDRTRRLEGLVNIGIDETSYRKGYKYITIVVNQDTDSVAWIGEGHGKTVLEKFFKLLTQEQRDSIKTVTGDGARWITSCAKKYIPQAERCVDAFHVVQWGMEALDKVRVKAWRDASEQAKQMAEKQDAQETAAKAAAEAAAEAAAKAAAEAADEAERKARDLEAQANGFKDAKAAARAAKKEAKKAAAKAAKLAQKAKQKTKDAKKKASEIKGSSYALGKSPSHLTNNQQVKLEMITLTQKELARAYTLKEELRLLLKMTDPDEAKEALKKWKWRASHSRIPEFHELYEKIKRNEVFIINTIQLGFSNARIEAMNNKIGIITRQAYGFRNLENMFSMIYLVCSDLEVELPNRPKTHKKRRKKPATKET